MQEQKPYAKPAVIFEKNLEAVAADCDPTGGTTYTGGTLNFCKAEAGICTGYLFS